MGHRTGLLWHSVQVKCTVVRLKEQQRVVVKHSVVHILILFHYPCAVGPNEHILIVYQADDIPVARIDNNVLPDVADISSIQSWWHHRIERLVREVNLHVVLVNVECLYVARDDQGRCCSSILSNLPCVKAIDARMCSILCEVNISMENRGLIFK